MTFEGDFRISQRNYLSKVERGTGTRNARRTWVNISRWYKSSDICQLFFCLERTIPTFFSICPIYIRMKRERIIGKFFVFCYFSSKKWWNLKCFICLWEFDIGEYYSFIRSLIDIEFPHFSINMTIEISHLMDLSMSYHHKKCYFIGYIPLIFIANIRVRFFGAFLHFKSKCRCFFSCFDIGNKSHSEFISFTTMNRGLDNFNSRFTRNYFFPVRMIRIYYKLSFDFERHKNIC